MVLVDQGPLWETGGSTSHAPGLVFQLGSSRSMTRLAGDTVRLPAHPSTAADADPEDIVYVKAFATEPQRQAAVALAANRLVAEQRADLDADGEAMSSDDGLRVWLLWRWGGSRRELIERDADVVRDALATHPVFAEARAVEARIFRAAGAA